MKKKLEVKCPQCAVKFDYYSSEFRPFCCEKCKMVDMGQWFSESYKVNGRDFSIYAEDPEKLEELLKQVDVDDF
ncbi:MAG: DNA gyrase inhibitor YacG [Bdellovibrionota bacterium]|nr:DNA gyrase inhibitor YacG [Bdellovibrionota bacterium]